jgi:hypothetical protein
MKKLLIAALVLSGFVFAAQAQQTAPKAAKKAQAVTVTKNTKTQINKQTPAPKAQPAEEVEWDFIQLGFWFGVPSQTEYTAVYGVKVGAPMCSGKGQVYGVETAVICGASDNVTGVQACIICSKSKKVVGFQGAIVNICDVVEGLQLGIFNRAKSKSFQIGFINIIEDSSVPFFPFVNFRF